MPVTQWAYQVLAPVHSSIKEVWMWYFEDNVIFKSFKFFITLKYFSEIEVVSPICQNIASRIKLVVICQNI